jgi:hypothetical protein
MLTSPVVLDYNRRVDYKMSVSQILGSDGKILPRYLPTAAPAAGVQNPLTATLQAFNPTQLVRHDITGADVMECSTLQTENIALVPGSLQTAIRVDESLELATAKRLEFQAAGEVAVASGQSLTLGGTLVAPDVAVAAAPHANVLGYNTVTGDIEYQAAGGGGGVTNPLSADLGCASFDLNDVGTLNFVGTAAINAAAGNDVNIAGGVGSTITLDGGGVSSIVMNSAVPAIDVKPDTGFCALALNATAASLVSGNKDVKLTLDGAANTATLQTSASRSVSINEAAQLVSLQANGGTTALALNGSLGGSAAIAANGNASIVLDPTGGGMCSITAADSFRLTGANLQSATSSGAAGVFLRIQLNSVYYKIALDLD